MMAHQNDVWKNCFDAVDIFWNQHWMKLQPCQLENIIISFAKGGGREHLICSLHQLGVLITIRTWHVFRFYDVLVTVQIFGVTAVLFTAIDTLSSLRKVSSLTGRIQYASLVVVSFTKWFWCVSKENIII